MRPSERLQRLAVFFAVVGFAALYVWVLIDTLNADAEFEPRTMITVVLPILSGALGLVLALALGVDPTVRSGTGLIDRLRRAFSLSRLLMTGAVVYMIAGGVGLVVWGIKQELTPELVTTVSLTVAGYVAAAVTALARPS